MPAKSRRHIFFVKVLDSKQGNNLLRKLQTFKNYNIIDSRVLLEYSVMKLNFLNNFLSRVLNKDGAKKGFTLAELMIVLAVLAVIAAVLMPSVFNSMPDENKLKFKKGYYTLKRTIDQMVNSDNYSATNGEFGKVLGDDETACPFEGGGEATSDDCARYFCIQFSEMLNSTYTQCDQFMNTTGVNTTEFDVSDITSGTGANDLDAKCSGFPAGGLGSDAGTHKINVATQDGIYWSVPKESFTGNSSSNQSKNLTGVYSKIPSYYAVICMDVDGPNGEGPFAFGIRRDGKVIAGARAKQWLQEGTTTTVPTPEDD